MSPRTGEYELQKGDIQTYFASFEEKYGCWKRLIAVHDMIPM